MCPVTRRVWVMTRLLISTLSRYILCVAIVLRVLKILSILCLCLCLYHSVILRCNVHSVAS
jgi:hypothetical protein